MGVWRLIKWITDNGTVIAAPQISGSWFDVIWLTVFHSVSMFSGYWLRFYAIPRLSTVTYSILSFTGLLASYLFGFYFYDESPGWLSIMGAIIIIVSGILLTFTESQHEKEEKEKQKEKKYNSTNKIPQ
jgi:drug/metabolite transporter (DMT)-like permease